MKTVATTLALMFFASHAAAHDLWLNADRSRLPAGSSVTLALHLGEAGVVDVMPFQAQRTERMFMTSSHGQRELPVQDGAPLVVPLTAPGIYAFGFISRPALSELPPEKFDAYLSEEGLSKVLATRRAQPKSAAGEAPVREHYSRSLKALVGVGDTPLVDCPIGLPLELIIVQADDSQLVVQARFRGKPLPGLWVDRGDAKGKILIAQRTDARGLATFPTEDAFWILRATHMEASSEAAGEWRSWWATTAFGWDGTSIQACPKSRGAAKAAHD